MAQLEQVLRELCVKRAGRGVVFNINVDLLIFDLDHESTKMPSKWCKNGQKVKNNDVKKWTFRLKSDAFHTLMIHPNNLTYECRITSVTKDMS